jgi:hypothetical protein
MASENFGVFVGSRTTRVLDGTEQVPVVESNVTYVTTVSAIGSFFWPVPPSKGGTGLATLTAHGLLVGEGTSNVAFAGPASAGEILISQGVSADPAFEAVSGDAQISSGGVVTNVAVNGVTYPASPAANTVPVANGAGAVTYVTVPVTAGGTNLTTLTAHAVLLGEGTASVGFATTGTAGRMLIDQGSGADPAFEAMSGDVTITNAGVTTVRTVNGGKGWANVAGSSSSNYTTTSSSYANLGPPFAFSVGAGQTWTVEFYIFCFPGSGHGGLFQVTTPATSTIYISAFGNTTSVTAFAAESVGAAGSSAALANTYCAISSGIGIIAIKLRVTTSNAGTVTLQYASAVNTDTFEVSGPASYMVARQN